MSPVSLCWITLINSTCGRSLRKFSARRPAYAVGFLDSTPVAMDRHSRSCVVGFCRPISWTVGRACGLISCFPDSAGGAVWETPALTSSPRLSPGAAGEQSLRPNGRRVREQAHAQPGVRWSTRAFGVERIKHENEDYDSQRLASACEFDLCNCCRLRGTSSECGSQPSSVGETYTYYCIDAKRWSSCRCNWVGTVTIRL